MNCASVCSYLYDHLTGGGPTWLSDTWFFDLTARAWRQAHAGFQEGGNQEGAAESAVPHGRMSHTCVVWRGALYMYGGDDGGHLTRTGSHTAGHLSDLWRFNVSAHSWTMVRRSKEQRN